MCEINRISYYSWHVSVSDVLLPFAGHDTEQALEIHSNLLYQSKES